MPGFELATYLHAHQQQACTLLHTCVGCFFCVLGCCPLLYVRTSYVSRDPVSYIVSAYLVSYCLLVRQQQRFHHPTLKPTPTCPSAASGVHGCIHVSRVFLFFFCWDVALYCTCVPGMCRTQKWKRKTWKKRKGCRVSNSRPTDMPIRSKRVHCCIHVSRVFFFWVGMLPFIVRAYLVCVAHKNENIKHEKK